MKTIAPRFPTLALLLCLMAAGPAPAATNFVWTGAGGGSPRPWTTAGNWSPAGPPGSNDTANFFNNGTAPSLGTVNNAVTANTQIAGLVYGQSNALFHTTQINPGVTLTIASTNTADVLLNGTATTNAANYVFTNAITGAGGTLLVNATNGNVNVRQATGANGVSSHMAVLDLSGLGMLSANISRLLVAGDGNTTINREQGTLFLAKTNIIVASWQGWTGTNLPAIGLSDGMGGNGGDASFIYLGQTNAIYADSISVAGFLGGHGLGSLGSTIMAFNPAFANPSAYIRGYSSSRVSSLAIADNSSASGKSTASIGTMDLSAGTVDAMVDTIWVARSEVSAGGNGAVSTGTLTLGAGTVDANTLELGYQMGDGTVVYPATGTVNVNGTARLLVNSSLRLAHNVLSTLSPQIVPAGTLNLSGGTVQMRGGDIVNGGGTATINVNSGLLDMQPPGRPTPGNISAGTIVVGGSGPAAITNAATITSSNVTINAGGAIAGSTSFNIGTNGSFTSPGFTLNGEFQGGGSVSGDFTQAAGAVLNPGGGSLAGTLAFGGNLTLNGGILLYDLSNIPSAIGGDTNDFMTVAGNLTLTGTNNVSITPISGALASGTYQLINYVGALSGNQTFFKVTGPIAQSRRIFSFDTSVSSQINLLVGGNDSANLRWVGDGSANNWDLIGTANWNNGSGSDKFYNLDNVTFDDTGSATPAVNLVGTLIPGSITVSNVAKNYSFSGSGGITGGSGINKLGSGSLTLSGTGTNNFTGAITVNGGSLNISPSGVATLSGAISVTNGSFIVAGTGAANLSGAISLDASGSMTYNRSDNQTLAGSLSGAGTLTQQGSGTLTLAGDTSTFDGPIHVNAGTLQAGAANALGTSVGGTTVASGATLDVNGFSLGAESVTVSGAGVGGNGAIINNGDMQVDALQNVTLAVDATFGGSAQWSIRSEPTTSVTTTLSTSGAARKLTKVGLNQVSLTSVNVDSALGDIDIKGGILSMENLTTGLGNSANTVTIFTNSSLQLLAFQTTSDNASQFITLNKVIAMNDGASLINLGGTNVIVSHITLLGSNAFNVARTIKIGSGKGVLTYTNSLTINGNISGAGSLNKQGGGTLYLAGANTFTGRTFIDTGTLSLLGSSSLSSSTNIALAGGTLDVTARNDGLLTLVSGQTLSGSGTITGSVVCSFGATVSPGVAIGTITITNGSLTLAGTAVMQVNKTSATSDLITATNIAYGGTLSLANIGGTLAAGDTFKLFDATTYSGAFTNVVPASPAPGLRWDISGLTNNGTVRLAQLPVMGITVSGTNAILAGLGGGSNGTYYLLSSTNVAAPLATWTRLATNMFDANGNFLLTNGISPAVPKRFFLFQLP